MGTFREEPKCLYYSEEPLGRGSFILGPWAGEFKVGSTVCQPHPAADKDLTARLGAMSMTVSTAACLLR